MKRLGTVSAIIMIVAILISPVIATRPGVEAQDEAQPTIAFLETRVAKLEKSRYKYQTKVAELESTIAAVMPADREGSGVSVSGSGVTVSDEFELQEGTYKVVAEVQTTDFDGFAAFIFEPSGDDELLFNEIIEDPGVWAGSVVYRAPEDGKYYVATENTGSSWKLSFEPR